MSYESSKEKALLLPTKCFCNGAVTSWFKVLSSFNVFVSWDRTRLRKGTTAETQPLVATLKTTVKLFNFIKGKPKTDFSQDQTIRLLVDYMPDFYRTHRQYINCVEFLDNKEWELALASLIELAEETEHYFSEDFWFGLADAAGKMDLTDKVDYCRKQIKRNEHDIKSKTPFGWTTIKFDDHAFSTSYFGEA